MPNLGHEREQEIFDACLGLTPTEQGSYLERTCCGDPELQARVARLLAAHRRAEGQTLNPLRDVLGAAPQSGATVTDDLQGGASQQAGATVGPYRLLGPLGEGGMGSVWLAERSDGMVNRPIALKLPRGAWVRSGLAARMAREREILAALNHPNVARLYDAGLTPDGQPYLALEYVEGRCIDEYCRDKGLDPKARLKLFVQVANAVAHAHAKLIVHRDIKPANILVTDDGQVRLLDFGIAKMLQDGEAQESELTQLSGRPFTPDYASPEQVAGEPITIGSDVYSLGVVLYELLAEARPYELKRDSRGALEAAILETEPARPSEATAEPALRRALRGDLDTIVLKALKKKPEDRYATVNAFAEDIERYLQGRPVIAQPDSRWYRMRKFVARNRLVVGASVAALFAVLVGAGVAVWQARVALVEKARAEEVKEFIASIFREADPYEGQGKALSAVDLLKQAKGKIDRSFDRRPELRVELLNLVGASLLSLQDTASADAVLSQVADDAQRALGADHPQTLHARVLLTTVDRFRGRTDAMGKELDRLLPLLRARPDAPADLAIVLRNRAHLAIDEGRYVDAEWAAKEAFEFSRARLGERHPDTVASAILLALAYHFGRKPDLALDAAERAYRLTLDVYRERPKHPTVIDVRSTYSRALDDVGRTDRAIEELTRAARDSIEVFGPASMQVGFYSQRLADYALDVGDIQQALLNGDQTVQILAQHAAPDSHTYASALRTRGTALLAARRAPEALLELSRAFEVYKRRRGPTHESTQIVQVRRALALAYVGRIGEAQQEIGSVLTQSRKSGQATIAMPLRLLGVVQRLGGDHQGALRSQQEALDSVKQGPKAPLERMRVLAEIGLNHLELGQYEHATSSLEKSLGLFRQLQQEPTPERADALVGMGRVKTARGRGAEALPLLEEADRFWREFAGDSRWAGEAALWLGRCYRALGRNADARQALARADKILSRSPLPGDASLVRLARVT